MNLCRELPLLSSDGRRSHVTNGWTIVCRLPQGAVSAAPYGRSTHRPTLHLTHVLCLCLNLNMLVSTPGDEQPASFRPARYRQSIPKTAATSPGVINDDRWRLSVSTPQHLR